MRNRAKTNFPPLAGSPLYLYLVDQQVVSVLVQGEMVEGGDEDGDQDVEDVLERGARLQVGAAEVGKLVLQIGKYMCGG